MKQGRVYHRQFKSYRSSRTSHLVPVCGHKANGDYIDPTSALRQHSKQVRTKTERALESIADALLRNQKPLTDAERRVADTLLSL